MATSILDGAMTWSMERDSDGHRIYTVIHRVVGAKTDGPYNVLYTTGLPLVGAVWAFDDDFDRGATCKPNAKVIPEVSDGDANTNWRVEQTFDTKPTTKCYYQPGTGSGDDEVDNPLLEVMKVSGTFTKKRDEAHLDRFGEKILNSAHEQIRGPSVEFDSNYPTVRIEQNVSELEIFLLASLIDTVNDAPMWGFAERCVKLSNVSWEKKYHRQCDPYFTRVLEFDINIDTFDRNVTDEGTKVLRGHWDNERSSPTYGTYIPDPDAVRTNPKDFMRYVDQRGNPARVILNGSGVPFNDDVDDDSVGIVHVEKYYSRNLFQLGLPTDLDH